jgi:DNA-3-methyladenine glycosylase I
MSDAAGGPSADTAIARPGPDGALRCPWATSTPDYLRYHDEEWGRPLRGDRELFERVSLEAFQSGLSWLTILRKRENFRVAFERFEPAVVAAYAESDIARLLADAGIVRNRAKIEATITNARATVSLGAGGLTAAVWSAAPGVPVLAPRTLRDVPASTAESIELARLLRAHGFRFVGPVTAYALMQAAGVVNDHLADCVARGGPPAASSPDRTARNG